MKAGFPPNLVRVPPNLVFLHVSFTFDMYSAIDVLVWLCRALLYIALYPGHVSLKYCSQCSAFVSACITIHAVVSSFLNT